MISKSTIDAIFNSTRVEEVIGDYIQLKRAGSSLKGLSPFSDEKSPSFMVSPSKQIWKDFSSGKGGNAVTFLMELEQFSYPEALRWLAKKYNIEIEEEGEKSLEKIESEKNKESLFILTEFAKKFFVDQLNNTDEGKNIGLSYFEERGFKHEIIQKFELGYSPKSWTAFADIAESKGYTQKLIELSGLVNYREDGYKSDKFRERVIFPIHSYSGRTLGFGGRTLRNDKKTAKYINSPENEIYHKSNTLYGLFQAKHSILKQDQCILVEGYTDVLSLYQSGIENTVASSGTALTKEQIRLIKRLTNNILLIYDGDSAGIKAAFRGIDLILEQEINIKILLLPEGEDPDSFARKYSKDEVNDFIQSNSSDFISFKAKILLEDAKNDPIKKAELVRDIISSIALVKSIIQREIYIAETSKIIGIREEVLHKELAQYINSSKKKETTPIQKKENNQLKVNQENPHQEVIDQHQKVEEDIVSLIMQYGDMIVELKDEDNQLYETTVIEEILRQFEDNDLEMNDPFHQRLLEQVIQGFHKDELRTSDFFLRLMDPEINKFTSLLIADEHYVSENWKLKRGIHIKQKKDSITKALFEVLLTYKLLYLDKNINQLLEMTKSENFKGQIRTNLLIEVMELTKIKKTFKKHLNRVL